MVELESRNNLYTWNLCVHLYPVTMAFPKECRPRNLKLCGDGMNENIVELIRQAAKEVAESHRKKKGWNKNEKKK